MNLNAYKRDLYVNHHLLFAISLHLTQKQSTQVSYLKFLGSTVPWEKSFISSVACDLTIKEILNTKPRESSSTQSEVQHNILTRKIRFMLEKQDNLKIESPTVYNYAEDGGLEWSDSHVVFTLIICTSEGVKLRFIC